MRSDDHFAKNRHTSIDKSTLNGRMDTVFGRAALVHRRASLISLAEECDGQWLKSLKLSPKSRVHIRSLMHIILECAMRWGIDETGRNPMSLVRITGATRKVKHRRALTRAQVQSVLNFLAEPFRTMVTIAVCLGLRTSEIMGLQWGRFQFHGRNSRNQTRRRYRLGRRGKDLLFLCNCNHAFGPR